MEIHTTENFSRLSAMTRILMETLEEQGILRALLQHTTTSSTATTTSSSSSSSSTAQFPSHDPLAQNMEIRYQGAMLELEKTVQKV